MKVNNKKHATGVFGFENTKWEGEDRIMVIGDGQILESGNHQSLMNQQSSYFKWL